MNTPNDFQSTQAGRSSQMIMVPLDGGHTLVNGMPALDEQHLLRAYGQSPELVRFLSPVAKPAPAPQVPAPSPLDFLEEDDLTNDHTFPAPRPPFH